MTSAPTLDVALVPATGMPSIDVLDHPFVTLAGRQASATIAPVSGLTEILFGDALVAWLGTTLPPAQQASQSPLGLDRGIRDLRERTFVPRDQAAVVFQWSGQSAPFDVTIRFPHAYAFDETVLLASDEVSWIREEDHEGLRLRTTVATPNLFSLVVARAGDLTSLANLHALVTVRAAQFRRDAATGVRVMVEPPSEAIDALWLVPPLLDSKRLEIVPALALLLWGDPGAARDILANTSVDDADPVLFALLATRYLDATGDIGFTRSRWPSIRERVFKDPTLFARIAHELKTTAASIGEPALPGLPGDGANEASWVAVVEAGSATLRPEVDLAVRSTLELVHRTLGLAPDGSRQRIRIAPQFPAKWTRVEVGNIRVGEAALELLYEQSGDQHAFRFRPTEGGVPQRVIFEPALSGSALLSARVDGTAASLDGRVIGRRVVSPVQLVLDHERTVVLTVAPRG